jgi:hypothetical protein
MGGAWACRGFGGRFGGRGAFGGGFGGGFGGRGAFGGGFGAVGGRRPVRDDRFPSDDHHPVLGHRSPVRRPPPGQMPDIRVILDVTPCLASASRAASR